MNKGVLVLTCLLPTVFLPAGSEAQQSGKVPRIGFLSSTSATTAARNLEAFREGLHEFGYAEGKNIVIEYRWAEGKLDRLPELAAGLVSLKVDLIVVASGQAIRAAKEATTTIPIVMAVSGEVVETGIIASLARPGGNITGMTVYSPEVSGKRLELLREAFPKVSRVAVLGDPTAPAHSLEWKELRAAGRSLAVELQSPEVRSPNPDFKGAFAAATKGRAEAFLTLSPPLIFFHQKEIMALVAKSRLPAMLHQRGFVDGGGLMSYGPDLADSFKRAAIFVDKILKGAKPADLPVEQPTKFEFIINLKAAKQIGVTIPPNVLARADRIIK
ncbi:MAG: ABC transporter substrate-binding protein [Deltaproteobacteria bacterium]|nr:ABC transporter substrate-binding protein [Deltaproteobacteria bacterium]